MFCPQEAFLVSLLALGLLGLQRFDAATLPQAEVNALNQIAKTMGASALSHAADFEFDANSCGKTVLQTSETTPQMNINCSSCQNDTCHVTELVFKRYSLPGVLPPEIVQLPYLRKIDFAYNYLSGSIPPEWASMQLESISVFGNRLSGKIPSYLGNISSLTYLDLEVNQFDGEVPSDVGKLVNLLTLRLSHNRLSGNLPVELSALKNLTVFRINDNHFNGSIPDYVQNWKQLNRLEIQASGLQGPIPSSISLLENMKDLKISDINGASQEFPDLSKMQNLRYLILKKCNIVGKIPEYVWELSNLHTLDLSFNKLSGEITDARPATTLKIILLTDNLLSGSIPESILTKGTNMDLSYNNFTWQSPEQPACRSNLDLNLNLFRSSSTKDLRGVIPCRNDFSCQQYWHSLYINCGGEELEVNGTKYIADGNANSGVATLYQNDDNWGFSSTGDFRDDNDDLNAQGRYIANVVSSSDSSEQKLYNTARQSPLSLTYYRYCLENGSYSVSLHFSEIQFTNDTTFASLGRRKFDIYIQDKPVEEDFDIAAEAGRTHTPYTKHYNASVSDGKIEIRFYWAGKGTQTIPTRGIHGPLISAIFLKSNFKPRYAAGKTNKNVAPVIGGVIGTCLVFLLLGILWWQYKSRVKSQGENEDLKLDVQIGSFTLKQIQGATNNFDSANKIGEGGFGPVYKGQLPDGTVIAVKQLSPKSSQGTREFLNEIGMISCLQHPNLVKLHGCCIEGDQLLLVYEYMENNSLSHALFGPSNSQIHLDWPIRHKICVGIAKGLAFLHEESRLKIVHRDIKGTNVLLDRDLNPKISDFGLAKLHEEEKTHVSTRIAGTIGYIAPEYALWGYLTYKADVYSFGILALEIISGKKNSSFDPENRYTCLLDWACNLQQDGKLLELVDEKLGSKYKKIEAEAMIKVALLCTNASPSLRPTMSEVVGMLEGTIGIPNVIPDPGSYTEDLRFKAIRDHQKFLRGQGLGENQACHSTTWRESSSSPSAHDLYEINQESFLRVKAIRQTERQTSESVPAWTVNSSEFACR